MTTYQILPDLSPDEYDALRADIAEHGIRIPVVTDEDGAVLDGHHRQRIAAELGIDYPITVLPGLDHEGKRSAARTLNLARRNLSRAQRRELIADELAADPNRSDREIGRLLGVDHKTVGSVRRGGETPEPGEVPQLDREQAQQLTQSIRDSLFRWNELVEDQFARGVSPAWIARQVRDEREAKPASEPAAKFAIVDPILYGSRLTALAHADAQAHEDGHQFTVDDPKMSRWLAAWLTLQEH